jgi:hypothetical protein
VSELVSEHQKINLTKKNICAIMSVGRTLIIHPATPSMPALPCSPAALPAR